MVVVFASEKAKLFELEEKIVSAIKKRGIKADSVNVEAEQIGLLTQTVIVYGKVERVQLLKHKWKLPLLSPVDEPTLARLRKDLSGYEIQEIYTTT